METIPYPAIGYAISAAIGGVIWAIKERYWPSKPRQPNRLMLRLGYGLAAGAYWLWRGLRGRRQHHRA